MTDPRAAGLRPRGPALPESGDAGTWEQKRSAIRQIVRAEVDRSRPIEEARRSIELIAESSIRLVERNGVTELLVVDDQGVPRTVFEDGVRRNLGVGDLVREIRSKHPKLFQEQTSETVSPASSAPSFVPPRQEETSVVQIQRRPDPEPVPSGTGVREPDPTASEKRDWLDLASPTVPPRVILTSKLRNLEQLRGRSHQTSSPTAPFSLEGRGPLLHPALERRSRRDGPRDLAAADLDDPATRRRRPWRAAAAGILLVLAVPALAYWGLVALSPDEIPGRQIAETPPELPTDSSATSSVQVPAEPEPGVSLTSPAAATGPLQGVPEVLDTATLYLQGKIVPLFGVEWVRGAGSPEDLARYINGREVECEEASSPGSFRCKAGTQDLSKVVLYNGGGRAKPDATPELMAAESAAKSARRGLWANGTEGAQP